MLLLSSKANKDDGSTGYTHHANEEQRLIRQLLLSTKDDTNRDIIIASNSPSWHIQKVLQSLGLAKLLKTKSTKTMIFTPDRHSTYPTKHQPIEFFGSDGNNGLRQQYKSISIMDDSIQNLKRISKEFSTLGEVKTAHINNEEGDTTTTTLTQALLEEFGLLDPTYKFSQVQYLESKNEVDRQAMHVETWNRVIRELEDSMMKLERVQPLWIVDLGAGLLSMLDLLLNGDAKRGLQSLPLNKMPNTVEYTAYESNQQLYNACHQRLLSWGFELTKDTTSVQADTTSYLHKNKKFRVNLILKNFADGDGDDAATCSGNNVDESNPPDLIIGCCFADLFDPERLVPDLIRTFGLLKNLSLASKGSLVYFPITFAGITQFLPPQPFRENDNSNKVIPSDTVAFRSYSRALETVLGHNLNPTLLKNVMEDYGAEFLSDGPSHWQIDPQHNPYLYDTMLHFFGSTGGPQLLEEGWDAGGWMRRARANRPSIQVINTDLLFRMPGIANSFEGSDYTNTSVASGAKEILFTAPYKVTEADKEIPAELGPRQVLSKFL
jgi:hypothetical protein